MDKLSDIHIEKINHIYLDIFLLIWIMGISQKVNEKIFWIKINEFQLNSKIDFPFFYFDILFLVHIIGTF